MLYYPRKHFLKVDRNVVFGLCDWPPATQATQRNQVFRQDQEWRRRTSFSFRLRKSEGLRIATFRSRIDHVRPWTSFRVKSEILSSNASTWLGSQAMGPFPHTCTEAYSALSCEVDFNAFFSGRDKRSTWLRCGATLNWTISTLGRGWPRMRHLHQGIEESDQWNTFGNKKK